MADIWSNIGVDITAAQGDWLYRIKGETRGPVPKQSIVAKLLSGDITLTTPVAREGGEFYPIGKVVAFAEHFEDAARRHRQRRHRRRNRIVGVLVLLLLCGGAAGGYLALQDHRRRRAARATQAANRAAKAARQAEALRKAAPKMKLVALSLGRKEDVRIRRDPKARRRRAERLPASKRATPDRPQPADAPEESFSSCTLSQSDIFGTLRRHLGKLNVCVEDAKARDTQGLLPKTLELEFVVKPSGQVIDFRITHRHYRRGPMNNCMIKAFRAITFPTSTGSNCPVTIPIKIGG